MKIIIQSVKICCKTFVSFKHLCLITFCFVLGACTSVLSEHGQSNKLNFGNSQQTTIAFGSCAKEREPQPIWRDIAKHNADAFLFIGDNQYADVQVINGQPFYGPVTDPKRFSEAYQTLASIPEFAAYRKQVPLMLGTWDDHDYGSNDAGKEFALKAQSQAAFIEFFGFEVNHPIHQQAGIYHSKILEKYNKKVQIIMLDTRYNRDQIAKNPNGRPEGKGPYIPIKDTNSTMLGKQQWLWLEQQLLLPADVRVIVSSIQVVAYQHSWEAWGTMPHQRDALYSLIDKTKANGVLFLSGDRHLMEISKDAGQLGHKVPYPMWDFTSSGLNQAYYEVNERNDFRIGEVVRDTNYGIVTINWDSNDVLKSTIELHAYGANQTSLTKASVLLADLQHSVD